jgi:hypothetical protein
VGKVLDLDLVEIQRGSILASALKRKNLARELLSFSRKAVVKYWTLGPMRVLI